MQIAPMEVAELRQAPCAGEGVSRSRHPLAPTGTRWGAQDGKVNLGPSVSSLAPATQSPSLPVSQSPSLIVLQGRRSAGLLRFVQCAGWRGSFAGTATSGQQPAASGQWPLRVRPADAGAALHQMAAPKTSIAWPVRGFQPHLSPSHLVNCPSRRLEE
jgi:hypothetical protein